MLKKLVFLLMIGLVSGCYSRGVDTPPIYNEPDEGVYGDDEGDDEGDNGDSGDEGNLT